MSQSIFTQTPEPILEDVEEFYFGYLPWRHEIKYTSDRKNLLITLTHPTEDDGDNTVTKTYEVSASDIKNAFFEAQKRGYYLCCIDEIASAQLGLGCAQDLNIILQTACYKELIFS